MTENTPGVKEGILEQANAEADDSAGGGESGAADARGDAANSEERRSLDDILGYKPFPKQRSFIIGGEIPAVWRGGGAGEVESAADGSGGAGVDHPSVNTLLLRRTFPELETSLLHYFRQGCAARTVCGVSTNRSTWWTWRTARRRGLDTARASMTFISTRARSFCLLGSMS